MRSFADADVAALPWPTVLDALRDAFRRRDRFVAADRVHLEGPGGAAYLTMPCADDGGWFGVKQVSVLPANPARGLPAVQAWYTLFGPDGSPAAAGPATALTKLRTAGVSAIAAEVLAAPGARDLLVVGAGALAPWMARAHLQVRPYERVRVWARDPSAAARVARALRADGSGAAAPLAADVGVATDLEAAVRAADTVTVATTSRDALVRGSWLRPGHHLDLVGAFLPTMRESDAEAIRACAVFVDDLAAARQEAGDLHHAAAEGWSWEAVRGDLAAILRVHPDRDPSRPTLFKSVGLALEDLALARRLTA